MTAPRSIDEMLAKARLVSPDYTAEEMAAAEARLEAKAAGRLVTGAITFDDATHHRLRRRAGSRLSALPDGPDTAYRPGLSYEPGRSYGCGVPYAPDPPGTADGSAAPDGSGAAKAPSGGPDGRDVPGAPRPPDGPGASHLPHVCDAHDVPEAPGASGPCETSDASDTCDALAADGIRRAVADLQGLCHILISQPDALHAMSTFIGGRVLEPAGARVLACVLHLAGREDSARFWWQYAAGADDVAASYCLYLHHMALGETDEAYWWQDQVHPLRTRELGATRCVDDSDRYALALGWTACLQIVVRHRAFTDATTAALAYVRNAVLFVDDDVDLPLPPDGFAERIEQITALV